VALAVLLVLTVQQVKRVFQALVVKVSEVMVVPAR